jgi:hypothetical protein
MEIKRPLVQIGPHPARIVEERKGFAPACRAAVATGKHLRDQPKPIGLDHPPQVDESGRLAHARAPPQAGIVRQQGKLGRHIRDRRGNCFGRCKKQLFAGRLDRFASTAAETGQRRAWESHARHQFDPARIKRLTFDRELLLRGAEEWGHHRAPNGGDECNACEHAHHALPGSSTV